MTNQIFFKRELMGRLEPNILDGLPDENIACSWCAAQDIASGRRFDVYFKTFYLRMREKNLELARRVYLEHIKVFSAGAYRESGNLEKVSPDAYLRQFDQISSKIHEKGFDSAISLIPCSVDGVICNGAHRLASAIVFGQNVALVHCPSEGPNYDFRYFLDRGLDPYFADIAATEFVEISPNSFIALLWPSAEGKDELVDTMLGNVVYKKNIFLNLNGAKNLMTQVYALMKWIGSPDSDYQGVQAYVGRCFNKAGALRVITFIGTDLNTVVETKTRIRELFGIGNSAIHISDTHSEAISLARLLFNDRALHFLIHANPNKYSSFRRKYGIFADFLRKQGIDGSDAVLDTGMVLASYGLRDADDIDYLVSHELHDYQAFSMDGKDQLNSHTSNLIYHGVSREDLIYDPLYHYYFGSVKLVSFNQLYHMKKSRARSKDLLDLTLMDSHLEKRLLRELLVRVKQRMLYARVRCRRLLVDAIAAVGLYNIAKKIYKKVF